jgi:hypothetical protein
MPKKETQWEIVIRVDSNDADYISQISKISESNLEKIKPLIKAIKEFKPYKTKTKSRFSEEGLTWTHHHNYPWGDGEFIPRRDLGEKSPREIYDFPQAIFDLFEELLPSSEHGFHTIESIEIAPYVKKTKLL